MDWPYAHVAGVQRCTVPIAKPDARIPYTEFAATLALVAIAGLVLLVVADVVRLAS